MKIPAPCYSGSATSNAPIPVEVAFNAHDDAISQIPIKVDTVLKIGRMGCDKNELGATYSFAQRQRYDM